MSDNQKDGLDCECVLDTGATESCISSSFTEKWKIPTISTEQTIRQADGSLIHKVRSTKNLNLRVNDIDAVQKFLVIPKAKHDVILGMDWLKVTKPWLYPASKIIDFSIKPNTYVLTSETIKEEIERDEYNDFSEFDHVDIDDEVAWDCSSSCVIKPQAPLNHVQARAFALLARQLERYIARDISELGKCSIIKHIIRTTDEIPIYISPYRKSQSERAEIAVQIDEMLRAGIIRKSTSAYSSPLIQVLKPNGTKRLCIDYREVNKRTIPLIFPIPRILDILDRLNGSMYFTTLDLKSGYWQVLMDEGSIAKTAFSSQDGHYEFLRLPFGLMNAPADFSRIMHTTLGDLSYVEVYLDDITIHSKTFEEHLNHIKIVMDRLKESNLKINHEKCTWCALEVKILGHIVSHNTIKMDVKKVMAVKDWKVPQNVKQVQQFLGLANYYRRFVKDFSKIAAPMFGLLKKGQVFNFSEQCLESFNNLKNALTSEPILRPPDFTREFFLYTDASGYCLGAVLGQKDDQKREYVIAYASRLLKGAELHYSITEKEALGVVFAIKYFRVYLYGKKFTLITDHYALGYMMKMTDFKGINPRIVRWCLLVQQYSMEIIHKPGKIHSNVDVLSRPIVDIVLIEMDNTDSYEKALDIFEYEPLLYFIKNGKHISGSSSQTVRRVLRLSKYYRYNGTDISYRRNEGDKLRLVPPIENRVRIILDNHLVGHFAARSTHDRLAEKYYWKKMIDQIVTVLKQCETCARNKKEAELNHPAIALKINGVFDRIGIDLVFGFPESEEGFVGIMVITEALTKYPWAKPIRTKTALEIASVLKEYICIFGAPKTIVSDQGAEFNNKVVDSMLNNLGVEHRVTSSYNPRANGLTERVNQTIVQALRKHVENDQIAWPKWLDWVLFAYRTRIHSSTGFTPFELLFGRKANSFEDWKSSPDQSKSLELENRSNEIKDLFESTVVKAKANIDRNQITQKKYQDLSKNILETTLGIGSKVMVKNDDKLIKKLESRYRGPYTIIGISENNNYVLEDVLKVKLDFSVPLHKLKIVSLEEKSDKFVEIEKIISHKVSEGKPLYLVKWRNLGAKDNSWVKPEDFASMKFVNDYVKSISNTRTSRSKKFITGITVLQILFLYLLLFPVMFGQIVPIPIKDQVDFDFCPLTKELMPMNLEELCTNPKLIGNINPCLDWLKKYFSWVKSSQNDLSAVEKDDNLDNFMPFKARRSVYRHSNNYLTFDNKIFNFNAYILAKSVNVVSGKAFQCKRVIFTRTYSMSFWGSEYRNDNVRTEKLDSDSCWVMINQKRCIFGNENFIMACDENLNCKYEDFPQDNFGWMKEVTKTFAHCFTSQRLIAETDLNSHIFNGICKVSDWFCNLHDSIIVWHRDVIHSCPFRKVSIGSLVSNGINFLEKEQKLGFQFKRLESHCGVDMILTTEGLYIAPILSELRNLDKYSDFQDTKGSFDLLLADTDFRALEIQEDDKYLLYKECITFLSILKVFAVHEDSFIRLKDYKSNEVILYTTNNMIFVPECVKIPNITLVVLNGCYGDLPISFNLRGKDCKGFLSTERVIRLGSSQKLCDNIPKYIPLPYLGKTIVYGYQKLELIESEKIKFHKFDFFDNSFNKNLSHQNVLVNGFDLIGQIHNLTYVSDNGESFLVIPGDNSNSKNIGYNFSVIANYIKDWFWYFLKIILGLATLIVLGIILYKIFPWIFKFWKTRLHSRRSEYAQPRPSNRPQGIYTEVIELKTVNENEYESQEPYLKIDSGLAKSSRPLQKGHPLSESIETMDRVLVSSINN